MFCTTCGESIADNHAFCAGCGRPVQKSLTASSQDPIAVIEAQHVKPTHNQYTVSPTTQYQTASPPPPAQQPVASPIYVTQQVQVAAPTLMRPPKSVSTAIWLAVLFGPFGLFYASILGGFVMLVGGLIATAASSGVAAPFVWIGSIIWASIAVRNYNAAALASYGAPTQINRY